MSKNGLRAIFKTFQPDFYKQIAFQPFGQTLKYLLLFVLIITVILSLKLAIDLNQGVDMLSRGAFNYLPEIFSGIPELKIESGKVSSSAQQPYVFQKDNFTFLLDTTGKFISLDNYKEGVLLTKDKLIVKVAKDSGLDTEVNEYDLNKMRLNRLILKPGDKQKEEILKLTWGTREFSITPGGIRNFAFKATLFLFPVFLIFGFVSSFVAKLFQTVLFSLVSLIIKSVAGAKLKYSDLLNIGVYALTPPTLLSALLILSTGITTRGFLIFWPIFYIIIYIVFLSLAIGKCKNEPLANPV